MCKQFYNKDQHNTQRVMERRHNLILLPHVSARMGRHFVTGPQQSDLAVCTGCLLSVKLNTTYNVTLLGSDFVSEVRTARKLYTSLLQERVVVSLSTHLTSLPPRANEANVAARICRKANS